MKKLFWLDDLQWASIEALIPSRKQRGPRRVPDRRIISFLRWSKKCVWEKIFPELSGIVGTHYENSIDSTAIKAHRAAHGKKGARRSASAGAAARPKSTRAQTAGGQGLRLGETADVP